MAKKKHHMTKHEYGAYTRRNHYNHSLEDEGENGKHTKSKYVTYRKKSDAETKKQLRNIRGYSDENLDEEYDEYGPPQRRNRELPSWELTSMGF